MVSQSLVRGIQSLLLRFGIFSRVRFAPDARADRKGCLVLSIRTAGDRRRFADEIGFVDPAKAAKLEASLELPGLAARPTKRLEIERIEELGETEVYDIQTESGEYLSGNVRVHNCFILAVEDTMRSILNWYTEEGIIFQGGSGSGVNLSNIRSSYEHLKGGGTASGPVSFMRGADASAGTIKSGGKTRRAAKMVILNADHPDVEDFIWCKAVEERKARVLRDNGFDMDLDGKDSHSTQYQNANNSVRVTDEFMQAVVDDADWHLRAVTTGEPIRTVKARDLFRQIAEAAWECADPGMQFDTTINKWHTASNTGRINGSNPCCFTGDTLVDTSWGLVRNRAAPEDRPTPTRICPWPGLSTRRPERVSSAPILQGLGRRAHRPVGRGPHQRWTRPSLHARAPVPHRLRRLRRGPSLGRRSAVSGPSTPWAPTSTTQSLRSMRWFSMRRSPSTTSRSMAPTTSASPPTPRRPTTPSSSTTPSTCTSTTRRATWPASTCCGS